MSIESAIASVTPNTAADTTFSLDHRIELCHRCIEAVTEVAEEWSAVSAAAKQCKGRNDVLAEEMLAGPVVVARFLHLAAKTLEQISVQGKPSLPGRIRTDKDQRVVVPIFPTNYLWDRITFLGLSATVVMQEGVEASGIHGKLLDAAKGKSSSRVSAILGAGNVSSVPATDSLHRILFDRSRVILKMNPVNEYLKPIFERAFEPMISAGMLSIIHGDGSVGHELIHHPKVTDVHITGSIQSHDAIVWGNSPEERHQRRTEGRPFLDKPITSELGNVSPWIVVPGEYTAKQMHSQAQHIASSITNNAAYNCLSTRVVITWPQWRQRDTFLGLIRKYLENTPRRPAYYPGSLERFRRATGLNTDLDENNSLPWTFLTNQRIDEHPHLFCEESFVGVCAEIAVEGADPEDFLEAAVEFVNDRLAGTLCASVTLPDLFASRNSELLRRILLEMRYGSVCINQWSALAYSLLTPPWGGYSGATLANAESGIGSVHNTFLLDQYDKAILKGPLVNFPKPVWFSTHGNALSTARRLVSLYQRPVATRLPALFASALLG
jgi:hypothetical protein